jgi:hypothetical protein
LRFAFSTAPELQTFLKVGDRTFVDFIVPDSVTRPYLVRRRTTDSLRRAAGDHRPAMVLLGRLGFALARRQWRSSKHPLRKKAWIAPPEHISKQDRWLRCIVQTEATMLKVGTLIAALVVVSSLAHAQTAAPGTSTPDMNQGEERTRTGAPTGSMTNPSPNGTVGAAPRAQQGTGTSTPDQNQGEERDRRGSPTGSTSNPSPR